ncbi:MAG: sigma-54-dependent Fis family transcriptional regulator [Magnetococcales bacterium]|nr:sigma-54-dependent Fis family transcriptional regulator [Magnetococcales bacterium]
MDDMQRMRARMDELQDRLEKVNQSWTMAEYEGLLALYVEILPPLFNAERCSIFFVDLRHHNMWLKMGTGLEPGQIEAPLEGSVVGRAVSSRGCIVENHLDRQAGFHTTADARTGFVTRNLICVPVTSRSDTSLVTGAVELLNKRDDGGFGAEDCRRLTERVALLSMAIDNILISGRILELSKEISQNLRTLSPALPDGQGLIAESRAMQEVLGFVQSVAATPVNVFISGENGTGKEVMARLIHQWSPERNRPFVAVNCASIPETLMESEFFGHEKGAFSGADQPRPGKFEEADGGTLFLDEIADLPGPLQPKFLRVLQEGESCRLGSNKVRKLRFRTISATNKDIRREVAAGRFREDLFYRLFSVDIALPPLRERPEDILPLAQAFLKETGRRFRKKVAGLSPEVVGLLESYAWPGNVRQLRREIERLVTLTPEGEIMTLKACSLELRNHGHQAKAVPVRGAGAGETAVTIVEELPLKEQMQRFEQQCIRQALERSGGNRGEAARRLAITRQWLHKRILHYGL